MVQPLKHYALRLWATVMLGGPATLWFLPVIGSGLNPLYTLAPTGAILLVVFFGIGALFNRLGTWSVEGQIRAAEDWERSGSAGEAETAYRRALSAFDSFLLSPRGRRRLSPELADHLARFYMTRNDQSTVSEAFIASHLQLHPDDEEIARLWLRQAGSRGWLGRRDQDLAARIGNAQPHSPVIQELLARYCLMEERTDYFALETYRRMMASTDSSASAKLAVRVADLFIEQGRADEWALPLYVRAFEQHPKSDALAAGIAACLKWVADTQKNRRWIDAGRRLLQHEAPERIQLEIDRFRVPELPASPEPAPQTASSRRPLLMRAGGFAAAAVRAIAAGGADAGRRVADAFRWVKRTPAAGRWLRRAGLVALAMGAIVLVVNTAGYLIRSEKRPEPRIAVAEATGRFTIQVAAYLNKEHAKRYAQELKQHDLDVYWTENSGDQKTWYQVRISRFEDKNAARTYGEGLKESGIIEDYYIANYEPPTH